MLLSRVILMRIMKEHIEFIIHLLDQSEISLHRQGHKDSAVASDSTGVGVNGRGEPQFFNEVARPWMTIARTNGAT